MQKISSRAELSLGTPPLMPPHAARIPAEEKSSSLRPIRLPPKSATRKPSVKSYGGRFRKRDPAEWAAVGKLERNCG
jgi:hypothetical protein